MKSKEEIAKLFKEQRDHAKRGLGIQYDNTLLCQSFYNDSQSNYSDWVQFADDNGRRRRAMVYFQKIPANIDAIVGFMAQNRRQAKFLAHVNNNKQQEIYGRNMNGLYTYHRENMNADQLESRQDLDNVVNGYGAIDTDLSYIVGRSTTNPNGEILKMNLDPMRVYWDSTARAQNVTDARYCGYFTDYKLTDALDLFQDSIEEDFEPVSDSDVEDKAGYVYNPWGGLYDKIKLDNSVEWSAKEEDMVRVHNHQWFQFETFYRCKNPLYAATDVFTAMHAKLRLDLIKSELKSYTPEGIDAGDEFDFDPTAEILVFDSKTKAKLVKEFGEQIDPIGYKRKCYYTTIISGSHVFKSFKSVSQRGFSVKFKTGQYNQRGKYWIGMVNAMIEPQKYYNKALTELMFAISANSKGGVMVEESAVEDIADFESKWAKTDAVVTVADGTLTNGRIQEKTRPALPTGLENVVQLADSVIAANGVDPAFQGQTNANETGILYKRRIKQILSKFWWIADAATLYQKEDARYCADLIRVWVELNAGQWINITGKDGAAEFMQISQDLMAPDYDVTLQEAPQTPEDQQETASFISSIGDKYMQLQDKQTAGLLYVQAIQMLPLDGDIKNNLESALVPNQQMIPAQQAQQAIQALQQELQKAQSAIPMAQVAKLQSEAQLNTARISEVQAGAKQRTASSLKDLEEAHRTNIETKVIGAHASQAHVSV